MNLTEKIYEALEMTSDDSRAFYNVSSGEIVWLNEYMDGYEEQAEEIDNNFENYIPLPTKYDINEYSMMRDFAEGYPDSRISSRLCRAISGRGAFRYLYPPTNPPAPKKEPDLTRLQANTNNSNQLQIQVTPNNLYPRISP